MPNRLSIIHRPTGIDHPYEPMFEERRPRDPSGGDMVALGFLTTPGNGVETVRVDWTRNGHRQTPIFARPVQRGTDEDRWVVELGVVEGGDRVCYQLTASTDDETVASPAYEFITRDWRPLSGDIGVDVVAARVDDATMIVTIGTVQSSDAGSSDTPVPGNDGGQLLIPRDGRDPLPVTVRLQYEGERLAAVELTAALAPDERIAGFGERYDAIDQGGRAPDTVVYEQYKNQGNRTYLPVPFFLSSEGYGLLVEGTTAVTFDVGRTIYDRWRCVIPVPASGPGQVAFDLFAGSPDEIVRAMTAITGRPDPLPAWAYGLWMSSNEWNTQERVEREVALTNEHQIPATVLVIEAWSDEATFYIWNGARYQPKPGGERMTLSDFTFPEDGPWPGPVAMTNQLRDQGIRLVLWQIPALKALEKPHPQHDADVAHALDQAFVLKDENGTPYRNPFFWFREALIPDFTDSAASDWWLGKRQYLLDELGIDGFKTDGGEHLAGRGLRSSDGRRGDELINAYPNLYVGAYHDCAKHHRAGDALTFSRAGHTGAGRFPAHWAGDENSTWGAFRRSIVAGLTAGLSGVIFWGWDLAGFSDDLPSTELYVRSVAMAIFCPIMQYHSEYNPSGPSRDRTPWNVAAHNGDDRAISLFRHFARVRMNLLPYIIQEANHAAKAGTPLMRPLFLDDADDPVAWGIEDQYRFGRSLLIAPVVDEGAEQRRLYLPAGDWVDFWTGSTMAGGEWITVEAPLDRIPVFASAGSVIPLRLGGAGRIGDDTGNGTSVIEGLTFWLAGDAGEGRWTDPSGAEQTMTFHPGANGTTTVDLPPLEIPVRIAAGGRDAVSVGPRSERQIVTLI